MYVLDTNSIIYFFKGVGRVADRLLAAPPGDIALPAIVLYELEVGLAKAPAAHRRREQLAEMVRLVAILPFGADEAKIAARLRADLEQRGTPIGPLDTLIAATAMSHGATLVTHNLAEFGRVEGLMLEDWF